jgi:hypothetical protein
LRLLLLSAIGKNKASTRLIEGADLFLPTGESDTDSR